MADQMEETLNIIHDDINDQNIEINWKNIQQSLYARSYLVSLSVAQSRPKTPSNKVQTFSPLAVPLSQIVTFQVIKGFTSRVPGNLACFIKAAFEIRRSNCPKALKIMTQDQIEMNENITQTGDSIRSMFYNNLGNIIYYIHFNHTCRVR